MKAEKIVRNFKTKYKYGFNDSEIDSLLKKYKINKRKFRKAVGVVSCPIVGGKIIIWRNDAEKGLRCVIENRNPYWYEMD